MTRWVDKPSMDSNELIDHLIESSQRFFGRYFSVVAKVGPPLFGFAIFLFYFNKHGFYPSFDLFQFSSLLLAAAILGFVIVGTSVLLLVLPGAWLHYGFVNTPTIKEDLRYIRPSSDSQTNQFVTTLLTFHYALPFASAALGVVYLTVNYSGTFQTALFLIPALSTLLCGLILQKLLELRPYSFLRFIWAAYFPTAIVAIFGFLTIKEASARIDTISDDMLKTLVIYGIPLLISLMAGLCALGFIAGWSFALHFSTFFALVIAFYSGALTVLPDKTVRSLGLGNYQAERILFEKGYCDDAGQSALPLDESCALTNVHIVWMMGDTLSFKTDSESGQLIQVPTRYIKAVIKAPI